MTLKNYTSIVNFWWNKCPFKANSQLFSLTSHFQANKTAVGRRWEWDADITASVPLQITTVTSEQHPHQIQRTSLQNFHTMSALFSSFAQSCPTLCNLMDCSMPAFPVHHQLPELTQTHVHWVGDAIQPSHSLSSPSPAFNLSQHQGRFFTPGGPSFGASASASVLPVNIQDWFPLGLIGLISLQSKGLSRVFSNTTVQKHQFFGTQLSL